jgi:hypothetical protein
MSCRIEALEVGSAARRLAGPARVFASFERSYYVESLAGIACVGGRELGRGPLNVVVERYSRLFVGDRVQIDASLAKLWTPESGIAVHRLLPECVLTHWRDHPQAQAFLGWISGMGRPDDALIGLGPGLTPAGDDFVGGAMIALRAAGEAGLAARVAAWALPLAETRTGRISRAHLACAASGEGHEALHALLGAPEGSARFAESLARLARIGHTSGLDAAAGALLALAARRGPSGLGAGLDLAEEQVLD